MELLKQHHNSKINLLLAGITCISLGWFIVKLQTPNIQELKQSEINKDEYFKAAEAEEIHLSFLEKAPTFGFDNLLASQTLLKFIQYVGDAKARRETGFSLSYKYLELIAEKDPRFAEAYIMISPASSVFGGTPHKTVALMDKGLKALTPDIDRAYVVWLYKAVDEVLFINNIKKARQSYEKAAEWATIAGDERIAKAAKNSAKFLSTNPDTRQAQVGAWFTVWLSTREKSVRDLAESEIERLGGTLTVYPDGRVEAQPPKINKK